MSLTFQEGIKKLSQLYAEGTISKEAFELYICQLTSNLVEQQITLRVNNSIENKIISKLSSIFQSSS